MVTGIDRFREWFRGYEDQYAIIGGTACDLLMSEDGMAESEDGIVDFSTILVGEFNIAIILSFDFL